ncbi:THUMP domain-containing class I SAM-dependent RNA methyltransferase [Rubellimicrobium arenae]|uniref:THUMP domain-containing class I SAM-dependent RNA methyltransferase n=1 Tax=Rubellimicrobium arenae TaxID=2817372 RepID=UPI001B308A49|nr:class I SAM-dependent RNA methyltransferase [Rubellimicrobium arenae]
MSDNDLLDIYLVAPPGLEQALLQEATAKGFQNPVASIGGVTVQGHWPEVWRANLELRGASRILARVGAFRALHLAQLDKRARKFPWADVLRPDRPVRVEASCKGSRIYHAGAVVQRIEAAIREELGAPVQDDAEIRIMARVEDDLCTISVDTSGELLHRRGHKEAVNKAPLRENLAALFLRECGYEGAEPVLDPMCGSGTFVIEAAEIAAGLQPGRSRSFAFEQLATFDARAWAGLARPSGAANVPFRFIGYDRDAGAVTMSRANAERAGVSALTEFQCQPIAELRRPEGPSGLVMVNPPYGARIGNKKLLYGLYAALGETLKRELSGWRVGLVTSEPSLAKVTGLSFKSVGAPVPHGGLKVSLYRT